MRKQVEKFHYNFGSYMHKRRWMSIWHQLDEVIALHPESVLEIGPGSGIFKSAAATFGLNIKTLDIDPALEPDYVASVTEIPIADCSIDVVCAFQVLEHMPFEVSMLALREMCRVARKAVVISLPDVETSWASTLTIPKVGQLRFVLPRPFFKPSPHHFDGEHYWEINKQNYTLIHLISRITNVAQNFSMKTYRVHENQYHRFFVLTKRE